jgi:hypothetical protein
MNCATTCDKIPKGAATDMSMNTLGCRLYHIQNITVRNMAAATHCAHAGPVGAAIDATAGVCGDPCTNFCALEAATCTGANSQFADTTTCMTACAAFTKTPAYSAATTSGNTFACHYYHLTNAAVSAAAATTHCPHTKLETAGTPCAAP